MVESNDIPALDDDVTALLHEAKAIPAIDAASKASLLAKVEAHIALSSGGGDGGSSGPPTATADPSLHAGAATWAARVALSTPGAVALALAVGVAGGVVLDRTLLASASPAATPPAVSVPPAPSTAETFNGITTTPALPSASALTSSSASPRFEPPRVERPTVSARGLSAERALLDVARTALARGEARDVLVAVERHEKEYPRGVLVEEREVLAIRALAALGLHEDASARASAFEQRFPNSLMLRAVRAAVGSAL